MTNINFEGSKIQFNIVNLLAFGKMKFHENVSLSLECKVDYLRDILYGRIWDFEKMINSESTQVE